MGNYISPQERDAARQRMPELQDGLLEGEIFGITFGCLIAVCLMVWVSLNRDLVRWIFRLCASSIKHTQVSMMIVNKDMILAVSSELELKALRARFGSTMSQMEDRLRMVEREKHSLHLRDDVNPEERVAQLETLKERRAELQGKVFEYKQFHLILVQKELALLSKKRLAEIKEDYSSYSKIDAHLAAVQHQLKPLSCADSAKVHVPAYEYTSDGAASQRWRKILDEIYKVPQPKSDAKISPADVKNLALNEAAEEAGENEELTKGIQEIKEKTEVEQKQGQARLDAEEQVRRAEEQVRRAEEQVRRETEEQVRLVQEHARHDAERNARRAGVERAGVAQVEQEEEQELNEFKDMQDDQGKQGSCDAEKENAIIAPGDNAGGEGGPPAEGQASTSNELQEDGRNEKQATGAGEHIENEAIGQKTASHQEGDKEGKKESGNEAEGNKAIGNGETGPETEGGTPVEVQTSKELQSNEANANANVPEKPKPKKKKDKKKEKKKKNPEAE